MLQCTAEFKDRLRLAMEVREIRAVDIAKRLGVSEGTISQYKSGACTPKAERLGQLARILRVNPAWLMGLDVPMEREELSQDERRIIKAYRAMSHDQQKLVCQMCGVSKTADDLPFK